MEKKAKNSIGLVLKKIRMEKKMTLSEVAGNTDITASLLSQIENNKSLPSLTSLQALCNYYQVYMSELFKQVEENDSLVLKYSRAETFKEAETGVKITLLASKTKNSKLDSYLIELPPQMEIKIPVQQNETNLERFVFMLSGKVSLTLGDQKHLLEEKDSVNFKSYVYNLFKNDSETTAAAFILSAIHPVFRTI